MEEGNMESKTIEFYPSKVRFWFILILGFITVILGLKLFSMELSRNYTFNGYSSIGFLLGWGSVVLIALMIEMMSLPKKMRLKNLKKYIIMFLIYILLAYGIKYFEPEIVIKIFGTFSEVLGITMMCYSLYRLIIKRPSIILSHEGIVINSECNCYGIKMIYWDEIEDVFVYSNYLKRALGFKIYNMKEFKRRQSCFSKIINLFSGHVSIIFSVFESDNDYMEREIMRYFEEFRN